MEPENKKMNMIALLSLLGSFQLLLLFSTDSSFQELAFTFITLSLFLAFSCLPYITAEHPERDYYIRIAGSFFLQVISFVLLLY